MDWCRSPDIGLPKPDIVLYLDVPPETALNRGGFGEERYEELVFQKSVYATFSVLQDPSWIRIDASKSIKEVHVEICSKIFTFLLDKKPRGPVEKLWIDK